MLPHNRKKSKRSDKLGFSQAPVSNTGVKVTNDDAEPKFGHYPKPVLEQLGVADRSKRKGIFFTAPRPIHPNGELGIDWLTVTCHDFSQFQNVRNELETKFFNSEFVEVAKKLDFYTRCLENELGVLILYSKEGERNSWHFTVKVPGKALKILVQQSLFQLLRYFYVKDFTCSRIDLHLDIFKLPDGFQTTNDFLAEVKCCLQTKTEFGNVVTGVRKWRDSSENNIGESKVQTVYLGSRQSEFCMRMYDKAIEKGLDLTAEQLQVDCPIWLRIESELKSELAQEAFLNLVLGVNDDSNVQHNALKKVSLGVINRVGFWDRKSKNLKRCKPLSWWQQITESVKKFKRSTVKPEPTIDKAVAWISKQVAPWFAAVALAIEGVDGQGFEQFKDDLISDGIKRLKDKHLLAVNEYLLLTET